MISQVLIILDLVGFDVGRCCERGLSPNIVIVLSLTDNKVFWSKPWPVFLFSPLALKSLYSPIPFLSYHQSRTWGRMITDVRGSRWWSWGRTSWGSPVLEPLPHFNENSETYKINPDHTINRRHSHSDKFNCSCRHCLMLPYLSRE